MIFGVFFALGVALSGYWIVTNPQRPLPDPTLYEGIGANLAAGNGFSFDRRPPFRPEVTRTPFLPVAIAALYTVLGRRPSAVLWMNAVCIGLALGMGYLVALKLFQDRRIAVWGTSIALLTPPVAGSANNILTEPVAMLQMTASAWLLLNWHARRDARQAPIIAAGMGLLLASLVLNRSSMMPVAIIAGAYIVFAALVGRWRSVMAWITAMTLCAALGIPVLVWSARNASLGLSFTPAPIGLYASRVFDMKRYREHLMTPAEKLPAVNKQYFRHWKRHYGPQELMALEQQNKVWFKNWSAAHPHQVLKSMPYRLIGLFSFFRSSIYPPWPGHRDRDMREIMRWISRTLWLLSALGLVLCWRDLPARWIWLGTVLPLVGVHLLTVCHSRYMFPLLPLLMPYGGVPLIWIVDRIRQRQHTSLLFKILPKGLWQGFIV